MRRRKANQCFQNAGRAILSHGVSNPNLRYCEGYLDDSLTGPIHHAWIEDVVTGELHEVTIPKRAVVKRKEYVAVISLTKTGYETQCLKLGWKPATCHLLDEHSFQTGMKNVFSG